MIAGLSLAAACILLVFFAAANRTLNRENEDLRRDVMLLKAARQLQAARIREAKGEVH